MQVTVTRVGNKIVVVESFYQNTSENLVKAKNAIITEHV